MNDIAYKVIYKADLYGIIYSFFLLNFVKFCDAFSQNIFIRECLSLFPISFVAAPLGLYTRDFQTPKIHEKTGK